MQQIFVATAPDYSIFDLRCTDKAAKWESEKCHANNAIHAAAWTRMDNAHACCEHAYSGSSGMAWSNVTAYEAGFDGPNRIQYAVCPQVYKMHAF